MDSITINNYVSRHPVTARHFYGVFPCDLLPAKKLSKGSFVISNTDPHTLPGEHWILISAYTDDHIIYFDSSGQSFTANKYFKKYNKRQRKKVIERSLHQLQAYGSYTCGPFVLLLALHFSSGCTFKSFLEKFSTSDLPNNDQKVMVLFKKTF